MPGATHAAMRGNPMDRTVFFAACLAAMLSGCGGGSGGQRALAVPEGLVRSAGADIFYPVTAPPPFTAPTLASGIGLVRDGLFPRSELTGDDAYVNTLNFKSGSSAGEFEVFVTYAVGGEEERVRFYGGPDREVMDGDRDDPHFHHSWTKRIARPIGGGDYLSLAYWSWHWVAHKDLQLSVSFLNGIDDSDGNTLYRFYATAGVRTGPEDLPSGTATYVGTMRGDTHLVSDPSSSGHRAISGDLRLTAKFDRGALAPITGSIDNIKVRYGNPKSQVRLDTDPPDHVPDWEKPGTTDLSGYFRIGNGRIVDGEFTASLTGVDDADAEMSDTVRGYEGNVLGAFYSANAQEVGGVLNARRADRVMAGVFGGVKETPAE